MPSALPAARDFETDEAIDARGLKVVGNQSLYRRGVLWVTPETEEIDLEEDKALITVVERFTPEYFELVAANTAEENRLLSSQQETEELLVNLRGQVYHIK